MGQPSRSRSLLRLFSLCCIGIGLLLALPALHAPSTIAGTGSHATVGERLTAVALAQADDSAETARVREAWVLPVDGMLTRGTTMYIERNLTRAHEAGAALVIIRLNTPGGLVDATLNIQRRFAESPVPVAVLVAPEGAIAASAGAFLVVSAHISAMAPGTTVGAAMPVQMAPEAGGSPQPADEKTVNFLAEHIREVARERGRNAEVAGRFVTDNLTLGSQEAVDQGIADFRVRTAAQLLEAADGHTIMLQGEEVELATADLELVDQTPTFTDDLHNLLSNPSLAFILLMVGIYGIYFGLSAPGTLVPEVLGTVSLVLGIYGMGLFSTSVAGVVLIVIGLAFLVAEAFTPTYGILGGAGALSLILGALLLPQEPWMPSDWFTGFRNLTVGTVITLAAFSFIALAGVVQSRRRRQLEGAPHDPSGLAQVRKQLDPEGMVFYEGELWRAVLQEGGLVEPGETVQIVGREGLRLLARPVEETAEQRRQSPAE